MSATVVAEGVLVAGVTQAGTLVSGRRNTTAAAGVSSSGLKDIIRKRSISSRRSTGSMRLMAGGELLVQYEVYQY